MKTTYHRDKTVSVWDVYSQSWIRTASPSDRLLASLSPEERDKVRRHIRPSQPKLEIGDRITAGTGEDRESGTVLDVNGFQVTVGWDSGVQTTQSVSALWD